MAVRFQLSFLFFVFVLRKTMLPKIKHLGKQLRGLDKLYSVKRWVWIWGAMLTIVRNDIKIQEIVTKLIISLNNIVKTKTTSLECKI